LNEVVPISITFDNLKGVVVGPNCPRESFEQRARGVLKTRNCTIEAQFKYNIFRQRRSTTPPTDTP